MTPVSLRRLLALEWSLLVRQPALGALLAAGVLSAGAALWDGSARVTARATVLAARHAGTDSTFASLRRSLDSAWRVAPPGTVPDDAKNQFMLVGMGDISALPTAPLAAIGSGSLDVHSTYPRISIWSSHDEILAGLEFVNPVLASGLRFDATFVVIYLLPLLIIGVGAAVVAGDREEGTLALLASHPVATGRVFLVRMLLRTLAVVVPFCVVIAVGVAWRSSDNQPLAGTGLTVWIAVTVAYALFWMAATFVISAVQRTVAGAALTGIATWLVITLLIPATLQGIAASRHPLPSRTELLLERREAQEWSERERPALLAAFKRSIGAPAAVTDSAADQSLGWIASTIAADTRVRPLHAALLAASDARHDTMVNLAWLSPATAAENVLLDAAGTGTLRFRSYRAQLFDFLAAWRTRYVPLIQSGRPLVAKDFDERLRFTFVEPALADTAVRSAWTTALLGLGAVGLSLFAARRSRPGTP
jgi:ABC-2 type transport system permease protein